MQTASARSGAAAAIISAVEGILSASDPDSPRALIGRIISSSVTGCLQT